MRREIFTFDDLPKLSQNEALAMHWGARKKIRQMYENLITYKITQKFGGRLTTTLADTTYQFEFKNNPLDCLNCCEMVKMIEDIIFKYDATENIKSVKMISVKNGSLSGAMRLTLLIEWPD